MKVDVPCGPLRLEGVLEVGSGAGAGVICHPHPQYGGDMHNPVVCAVAAGLGRVGYTTLRFNFRGVGRSTGRYDGGLGEQDDTRTALDFVQAFAGTSRLLLAGYSFGASVALAVGPGAAAVEALVAVAPPVAMVPWDGLATCTKAKLFLVGSGDQFIPVDALDRALRRVPQPWQLRVLHGADHFLFGADAEIAAAVGEFALAQRPSA